MPDRALETTEPRPGPLTRLWTTLRGYALDDRLLAGEPPTADRGLAVRRATLLDPARRRKVARDIQHVADEVIRPESLERRSRRSSCVRLRRQEIRGVREMLLELSRDLVEEPHPSPRGVILADRLVHDGRSPFYDSRAPLFGREAGGLEPIEVAVRHARAALLMG
jgi:hypothetical protein